MNEIVINALLNNDPAGCRAALAGSSEASPKRAFDGQIEVRVVKHDHGILTAKFQRAMLEGPGSGRADGSSNRARSGKRNRTNLGMFEQWRTGFGSVTSDDIDDAFRNPGISQNPNQIESRKRSVLRRLDHAGVAADKRGQQFP